MNEECVGYLKYTGDAIRDGVIDAKKAAQALVGFDEAIRFFLLRQNPEISKDSFDVPVKIRPGSLEVLLWIAGAYGAGALAQIGANDVKNISLRRIFSESVKGIQQIIVLAKHLGGMAIKEIKKIEFKENNQVISIGNDKGEFIDVSRHALEAYLDAPANLLSKISELVEIQREAKIGVVEDGVVKEIKISIKERHYFVVESVIEDVVLPELAHGLSVELEGVLTRGNGVTNNLGFRYQDHILTCVPVTGSITVYRDALFRKCKLFGVVSRADELGRPVVKRPRIIFHKIIILDNTDGEERLF